MTSRLTIVTSWDDGHPSDMRLADLLVRHGLRGTFFVPRNNAEGRPTLAPHEIGNLAATGFEIAAHTADHVRLDMLDADAAARQIDDGTKHLEDAIGARVRGFAYPGGRPGRYGRALAATRFAYARTTRMFRLDAGDDPYDVPTTMQFFPHERAALLRNFARGGAYGARLAPALRRLASGDPAEALAGLARMAKARSGVLHIWGHSWEFDALDLWAEAESAFATLSRVYPDAIRATVADIAPCAH